MFQFKLSQLMKKVSSSWRKLSLLITPGDEYQIFKLLSLPRLREGLITPMTMLCINCFCLTNRKFDKFLYHLDRHVLNNLDVGRFGTTYTIMNSNDGTVIVNATNQLADLYVRWNSSVHDSRMLFLISFSHH